MSNLITRRNTFIATVVLLLVAAATMPLLVHGDSDQSTYVDSLISALEQDLQSGNLNEEGRVLTETKLRNARAERESVLESRRQVPDPAGDATKIASIVDSAPTVAFEQTMVASAPDERPVAGNGKIDVAHIPTLSLKGVVFPRNAWVKQIDEGSAFWLVAGLSYSAAEDGIVAIFDWTAKASVPTNLTVLTKAGTGALRVIGGEGDVVILQSESGATFRVDTAARKFVE